MPANWGAGLDDGQIDGIAHDLGVVVLDDRLGHHIGTGREVDERGSGRGGVAALPTAVHRRDGLVDRGSVIGRSITCHDINITFKFKV